MYQSKLPKKTWQLDLPRALSWKLSPHNPVSAKSSGIVKGLPLTGGVWKGNRLCSACYTTTCTALSIKYVVFSSIYEAEPILLLFNKWVHCVYYAECSSGCFTMWTSILGRFLDNRFRNIRDTMEHLFQFAFCRCYKTFWPSTTRKRLGLLTIVYTSSNSHHWGKTWQRLKLGTRGRNHGWRLLSGLLSGYAQLSYPDYGWYHSQWTGHSNTNLH